jgi:branched-chain amino acid transport system substrate-binding protein
MEKRSLVLVVCVCLALAFGAPNMAGAKEAPKTIKISSVLSFGGMFAGLGKMCKNAYELWLEKVNSNGGIYVKEYGKKIPVQIKYFDDESNGGRTQFQLDAANDWGAVANLGGIGCSSFEMGTPMAQKNKLVWIGPGCGGWMPHQLGNKWMFNTLEKTKDFGLILQAISKMPEATRPRKVAIFEINQLDCNEAALFWRNAAQMHDFEVVYDRKYAAGTKDFSAMITAAKGAGAEILLSYPTPVGGPTIIKQMKMLDWNPKVIFMSRAPMTPKFSDLGRLSDYVTCISSWLPSMKFPGCQEFVQKYTKTYGSTPAVLAGPAYIAAQVLEDAINRAGCLDRKAIRDAIAASNLMTIGGIVKYTPNGSRDECGLFVFQWYNNKTEVVAMAEWCKPYVKEGYIDLGKFRLAKPWSER